MYFWSNFLFLLLLFQFEDSEDDFDRFDTDDELSYRRDSVYSCVTLPYFHSFLYIKGASFLIVYSPFNESEVSVKRTSHQIQPSG